MDIPLISIIVPVYNVEKYLFDCINSLLHQSLNNIEILLIDDGSSDESGRICDGFLEIDKRIRVIHQTHSGCSSARNTGIDNSKAKFLMFVDSDDWVEPDFCRIPFEIAECFSADLVIFEYRNTCFWKHRRNWKIPDGLKSRELIMQLVDCSISGDAWNKLYHKDLFSRIRYPEGYYFENAAVTHWIIQNAKKIYYTNTVLYNYRKRKGSITTHITRKAAKDRYELNIQKAKELHLLGYNKKAEYTKQMALWSYLIAEGKHGKYSKECLDYYLNLKNYPVYFPFKTKMMLFLCQKIPVLFDAICIVSGKRVLHQHKQKGIE